MKIKSIEINNYKAFYGKHRIAINRKNVFIALNALYWAEVGS